jgi:hypothetical protein
MKTQSINWTTESTTNRHATGTALNQLTAMVVRAFTATVGALSVLAGMAIMITLPQYDNYMQAGLWAVGFIFLALAIEAKRPAAFTITGLALPAIALLSYHVATEWAMVAAATIAAWVVFTVYRRK